VAVGVASKKRKSLNKLATRRQEYPTFRRCHVHYDCVLGLTSRTFLITRYATD